MIRTVTKMTIARQFARPLVAGRSPIRNVTRARIRWRLDLQEAIDISIFLTGYFQRRVTRQVVNNLPRGASTFIDVGCNRGGIAVPVAQQISQCRVIAIDPVREMIDKLRETLRLNPQITNVEVVCAFLGAPGEGGTGEMPRLIDASWNVFAKLQHPDESCATALPVGVRHPTTLDALCDEMGVSRVDVIKIDVDGYELEVLKGASRVLRRWSPVLIMEWATGSLLSRGCEPRDLARHLAAEGYEPLRIRPFRRPKPFDWFELMKIPRGESCELLLRRR